MSAGLLEKVILLLIIALAVATAGSVLTSNILYIG